MIEIELTDTEVIKTVISENGYIHSSVTYRRESNLPEDIRTKLSALKLMPDYTDVPDIGQRVTDKIFWVYEEPLIRQSVLSRMMLMAIKQRRALKTFYYYVHKEMTNVRPINTDN